MRVESFLPASLIFSAIHHR